VIERDVLKTGLIDPSTILEHKRSSQDAKKCVFHYTNPEASSKVEEHIKNEDDLHIIY